MKKLLFLMVFVALIGCENGLSDKKDREQSPALNTTAGTNETVVVEGINVTVVNIEDSRCPSDVVCIWDGVAVVDFKTEGLTCSLMIGESKEFSSAGSSFRLTLIDITPFPSLHNPGGKKEAIFTLDMI
jgi:hypothetical protein